MAFSVVRVLMATVTTSHANNPVLLPSIVANAAHQNFLRSPTFLCFPAGFFRRASRISSAQVYRSNRSVSLYPIWAVEESISQKVWREYDRAVEKKDLGKALRILESLEMLEKPRVASSLSFVEKEEDEALQQQSTVPFRINVDGEEVVISEPPEDLRKVLDACLNATDLKLVGRTYNLLQLRGLIPSFGKYKSIPADGPRDVTPTVLLKSSGLDASKLSPKKWGLSGKSVPVLLGVMAFISFLVNNGVDVRPLLGSVLVLAVADAVYVGGTGLAQVLSLWPPYRRRVLVHEAGHVLVAYLLGCPVRGVILDAVQAMTMGIQGQAGTQFWDETLEGELRQGRLTSASFDRYSMVLFAGIAAEALVYGEAEGGENDENLFKAIVSLCCPPWSPSQMSNQARWAVLQSFRILKEHRRVLEAVITSLEEGATLGTVIRKIEDVLVSYAEPMRADLN